MQYIYYEMPYSEVLQYYMWYAYITLEPLNGKMGWHHLCDPKYDINDVIKACNARDSDSSTNEISDFVNESNPHFSGGINARWDVIGTDELVDNYWGIMLAGPGIHGKVEISYVISPEIQEVSYKVVYDKLECFASYYHIFNGVMMEWGRFSPHLVRRTLCIEEHTWEYPCDVKFEF